MNEYLIKQNKNAENKIELATFTTHIRKSMKIYLKVHTSLGIHKDTNFTQAVVTCLKLDVSLGRTEGVSELLSYLPASQKGH